MEGGDRVSEPMEIAKLLHDTPDLFPWVLLGVVLLVAYKQRGLIGEYVRARIDYWRSMKDVNATLPEVIRNNTSAMNLCSEAFRDWKSDRGENRRLVEKHEQLSLERHERVLSEIEHVRAVVNDIEQDTKSNATGIAVLKDRTNQ